MRLVRSSEIIAAICDGRGGVELRDRTEIDELVSAFGPERTLLCAAPMSAFGGKADMTFCGANVCFWPKADIRTFRDFGLIQSIFLIRTGVYFLSYPLELQMPAYYIGEHIVSDFTLFDAYLAKVVPMIERFGGRYLTKVGSHEILEGDWRPNRVVIIEFPDMASIKNWYRAPKYQPLIALRRSAATDVMIMLEGL
jgi:uncharacterized protein (DUF1330 family)